MFKSRIILFYINNRIDYDNLFSGSFEHFGGYDLSDSIASAGTLFIS